MTNISNSNNQTKFNLEEGTLIFAKSIINFCKKLPNNTINSKLIDQIIRSAGSIGANYREASDSLGKKDFIYRLRISRKESKETIFWLELIKETNPNTETIIKKLINECIELKNILSAIINKIKNKNV